MMNKTEIGNPNWPACIPFLPSEQIRRLGMLTNGKICMTNYRILFYVSEPSHTICIPNNLVWRADVVGLNRLKLTTKLGNCFSCSFQTEYLCELWTTLILSLMDCPREASSLFAVSYRRALTEINEEHPCLQPTIEHLQLDDNDTVLDAALVIHEFKRLNFNDDWKITDVNSDFQICSSYPKYHIMPRNIKDADIPSMATFRSHNRFPTVVWRSKDTGAVLIRCAQPCVGIMYSRSELDEMFVRAILSSCQRNCGRRTPSDEKPRLLIVDARNYSVAQLNRFRGGGFEYAEYYEQSQISFMDLPNLHAVRLSFERLSQLYATKPDVNWYSLLEKTAWLTYVSQLLKTATEIATTIDVHGRPVMVHCTDGWDRTPQLTSLSQILLDPYYRTIKGFRILVEREWLQFGHKFGDRCGHGVNSNYPDERSPIFLQWLDCVRQVQIQFPACFEFNELFLIKLAVHTYSGLFGTFFGNSERERQTLHLPTSTCSLWVLLTSKYKRSICNYLYKPKDEVLKPTWQIRSLRLWDALYQDALLPSTANSLNDGLSPTDAKQDSSPLAPVEVGCSVESGLHVETAGLFSDSNVHLVTKLASSPPTDVACYLEQSAEQSIYCESKARELRSHSLSDLRSTRNFECHNDTIESVITTRISPRESARNITVGSLVGRASSLPRTCYPSKSGFQTRRRHFSESSLVPTNNLKKLFLMSDPEDYLGKACDQYFSGDADRRRCAFSMRESVIRNMNIEPPLDTLNTDLPIHTDVAGLVHSPIENSATFPEFHHALMNAEHGQAPEDALLHNQIYAADANMESEASELSTLMKEDTILDAVNEPMLHCFAHKYSNTEILTDDPISSYINELKPASDGQNSDQAVAYVPPLSPTYQDSHESSSSSSESLIADGRGLTCFLPPQLSASFQNLLQHEGKQFGDTLPSKFIMEYNALSTICDANDRPSDNSATSTTSEPPARVTLDQSFSVPGCLYSKAKSNTSSKVMTLRPSHQRSFTDDSYFGGTSQLKSRAISMTTEIAASCTSNHQPVTECHRRNGVTWPSDTDGLPLRFDSVTALLLNKQHREERIKRKTQSELDKLKQQRITDQTLISNLSRECQHWKDLYSRLSSEGIIDAFVRNGGRSNQCSMEETLRDLPRRASSPMTDEDASDLPSYEDLHQIHRRPSRLNSYVEAYRSNSFSSDISSFEVVDPKEARDAAFSNSPCCYRCMCTFSSAWPSCVCSFCTRLFCAKCANNWMKPPERCQSVRVCDTCFQQNRATSPCVNFVQSASPRQRLRLPQVSHFMPAMPVSLADQLYAAPPCIALSQSPDTTASMLAEAQTDYHIPGVHSICATTSNCRGGGVNSSGTVGAVTSSLATYSCRTAGSYVSTSNAATSNGYAQA